MKKPMMYVTGDTHGAIDIKRFEPDCFRQGKALGRNDYIIIAGDFGCVWDGEKNDKQILNRLKKKPFTTLFIDGNHENFDLLNNYPIDKWNGGKVHRINEKVIHLMRGQVFDISGTRIFTFGGASSCDKAFRRENISWWKEELPSQEEMDEALENLKENDWEVDYIVTHTAPTYFFSELKNVLGYGLESDYMTDFLESIYKKTIYRKWFFGHFHIDAEIDEDRAKCLYYDFDRI